MMRTSYDAIDEADVSKPVLHLVRDLDNKHVEGHNRLRVDYDQYDARLLAVERSCASHETTLTNLPKRTTDISSLRFTPQTVVAAVLICGSIIGGSYASTWSSTSTLRNDVAEIKAAVKAQDDLKKLETKIQDERDTRIIKDIGEIRAQQKLQDLQFSNLRETVLTQRK